ncbi:MAG TPA: hypothetical protein VIH85_07845 [Solirubrobacteraceae bacterium]
MSTDRPSDVLGALPRRRPHRRSDKRAAPAATQGSSAERTESPAKPRSTPARGGRSTTAKRTPAARRKAAAQTGATARTSEATGRSAGATARTSEATARSAGAKAQIVDAPPGATRRRPERLRQPAQPPGVPPMSDAPRPEEPGSRRILGTAAQAAAELAEIGLTASARALRNAVARLPRP